jgi:hypothetical protein
MLLQMDRLFLSNRLLPEMKFHAARARAIFYSKKTIPNIRDRGARRDED